MMDPGAALAVVVVLALAAWAVVLGGFGALAGALGWALVCCGVLWLFADKET